VTTSLEGVRVLDLTRLPPGAYCTLLLSDLGADVVRVEPPGSDPMMGGIGVGLNRGKRSIALDLRHEQGNAVLARLAAWADVVVENNDPGLLESRGFGYRQAAEADPSLIWCSITGFGQDGPYAQWSGHDITYTASSGLLASLNADLPWHPQVVLAVPLGAMMATTGIVAALYEREHTGKGGQLDISLTESAQWLLAGTEGDLVGPPRGIPERPNRRLYQGSDGKYLTVAAAEPRAWRALCNGLGLDRLAEGRPGGDDPESTAKCIAEKFATRPVAEWVAELGPTGAAVGMVNLASDLRDDPHVRARRSLVEVDGTLVPASPIRRRDVNGPVPEAPLAPPPSVGGNTLDVLAETGLSVEEINQLESDGVVAAG
jgi:crotonobetainyl-CoA:carnitine CoA-transferase CaiB-like acyl-CoA transferase